MNIKAMYFDRELAALAKHFRKKTGRRKAAVAREVGITRSTMQDVEERPQQALAKLRIRVIEKFSPYTVIGPVYILKRKK
jgi:DNA-binding XRE family transcriptional regulator